MHLPIRLITIAAVTFALTCPCAMAIAQDVVGDVKSVTGVVKLATAAS